MHSTHFSDPGVPKPRRAEGWYQSHGTFDSFSLGEMASVGDLSFSYTNKVYFYLGTSLGKVLKYDPFKGGSLLKASDGSIFRNSKPVYMSGCPVVPEDYACTH